MEPFPTTQSRYVYQLFLVSAHKLRLEHELGDPDLRRLVGLVQARNNFERRALRDFQKGRLNHVYNRPKPTPLIMSSRSPEPDCKAVAESVVQITSQHGNDLPTVTETNCSTQVVSYPEISVSITSVEVDQDED